MLLVVASWKLRIQAYTIRTEPQPVYWAATIFDHVPAAATCP